MRSPKRRRPCLTAAIDLLKSSGDWRRLDQRIEAEVELDNLRAALEHDARGSSARSYRAHLPLGRGDLRQLRSAPGASIPGWAPADGAKVLHQQRFLGI